MNMGAVAAALVALWYMMNNNVSEDLYSAQTGRDYDTDILARTLWGEARGEGALGMQRVANVIMNRVDGRRWPNDVSAVCTQPYQFSAWNANDPNRAMLLSVTEDNAAFRTAILIAQKAVNRTLPDLTNGATHYFNPNVVLPSWASALQDRGTYGNHRFMMEA